MIGSSWYRLRRCLASSVLALAVVGCGAVPALLATSPTAVSTTVAQEVDPATESAALAKAETNGALVAAPGQKILWGKIWNCGCHGRDGADSVAAELEFDHLPSEFKSRLSLGQYDYFAISFDPKSVDQDQLEKAIKAAGAKIVNGPPASAS
jgi:hypothetical protein